MLTAKVGRLARSLSHFAAQHAGGLQGRRNFEKPEKRFKSGEGWAPGPVCVGQTQAGENDLFCGWSAGGRGLPYISSIELHDKIKVNSLECTAEFRCCRCGTRAEVAL